MNDLIVNNELSPSICSDLKEVLSKMKELKDKEANLKEQLLKEMEEKNLIKLDSDELTISYIAPTKKETFDSKKFRGDYPEIYDDYIKLSNVKASIRIKLK